MKIFEGEMMDWVKCSDRLPEDRIDVLVFNGKACSVSCYCFNNTHNWWSHNNEEYDYSITHWMPLPEVPNKTI